MLPIRKFIEHSLRYGMRNGVLRCGVVCRNNDSWTPLLYACVSTVSEVSDVAIESRMVESPELPDWLKYCQDENGYVGESEDDFELPNISEWAKTRKLDGDSKRVELVGGEVVDSDVDKVCGVLKENFDSPEAVGSVLSVYDGIDLSESLVEKILLRFRHEWIPAFGFFQWAEHQEGYVHTPKCYDMMVDILGMSRKFDLMWKLVEEMDKLGEYVSFDTMSKVLRRFCKFWKYDDAIEAFEKFEKFGVVINTAAMNTLIDTLAKEKNVERAHEVFLDLKDKIHPNSHTFNILIHGWCKARNFEEARQVMEEMEKHGYCPDVVSYTGFVEYYCREKDFRKVDEILDEMHQKGCPPNVVTYTIVMHALGKAKEISKCFDIYHKMKGSGCVPDTSFCSALIFILSKSGRFKDACDLFEDMPKQNVAPDLRTYNTMIAAACMQSKDDYALELLKDMKGKSCEPNLKTYMPLLKMCCEKKRMKLLNNLLADMFHENVSLDLSAHCFLVDHLCESGKLEHACSFFEQMMLKGMVPRDNTCKLLMENLKQKGMWKALRQLKRLMLEVQRSAV